MATTGLGFVFLDIRAGLAELRKTSEEGTPRLVQSIGKAPRVGETPKPSATPKSKKSQAAPKPAKKDADAQTEAEVVGSCPNCAEQGPVGTVCNGPECRGLFRFTRDSIRS